MIEHTFERISEAEQIIATGVDALRPEVLDSETAAKLVERFAHIERTAAGARHSVPDEWRTRGRGANRRWLRGVAVWSSCGLAGP